MEEKKLEDLMKMDLYALIGCDITATTKEIKAAYRKKALSCHPDKNPDNPRAAQEFLQLSKILEILTDEAARNAYDQVIKARQQAKIRSQQLDAKRRKIQEDLEAREEAYRQSKLQEKKLKEELERLEKEGKKQLEEEIRLMQEQMREQIRQEVGTMKSLNIAYEVKLKWKADKNDPTNGGYNYDLLYRMLSKYGDIEILLISSRKKGRGIVEFKTKDGAESAIQIEPGLPNNPLKLIALWHQKEQIPLNKARNSSQSAEMPKGGLFPSTATSNTSNKCNFLSFSSAPDIFGNQNKMSEAEYENSVLTNLKRAEERKKLIEQMRKEDEEGT